LFILQEELLGKREFAKKEPLLIAVLLEKREMRGEKRGRE
jgi:hypothetical protein